MQLEHEHLQLQFVQHLELLRLLELQLLQHELTGVRSRDLPVGLAPGLTDGVLTSGRPGLPMHTCTGQEREAERRKPNATRSRVVVPRVRDVRDRRDLGPGTGRRWLVQFELFVLELQFVQHVQLLLVQHEHRVWRLSRRAASVAASHRH